MNKPKTRLIFIAAASLAAVASLFFAPAARSAYDFPTRLSDVDEGRRVYLKYNCYGCHGLTGAGGMGPNIVGEADDTWEAVRQGEGEGMPAYSTSVISDAELAQLQVYMNTIGRANSPTWKRWWEERPSDCANC